MTSLFRKLTLAVLSCGAALGQTGSPPEFEYALVHPVAQDAGAEDHLPGMDVEPGHGLRFSNVSLGTLVALAFGVGPLQISGPPWLGEKHFDIVARVPWNASPGQTAFMLQSLLAQRFGLALHYDDDVMRVFAMEVAEGGIKLQAIAPSAPGEPGCSRSFDRATATWAAICKKLKGPELAMEVELLGAAYLGGRPVIDMTNLPGFYNFKLNWVPYGLEGHEIAGPTIFEAIQQQLGLRLTGRKRVVPLLIIDHIDMEPRTN